MAQRNANGVYDSPRLALCAGMLLAFIGLTVLWTWPLAADLSGHIRGLNDPYLFAWILGWVSQNLFAEPLSLFDTNVFWPYGLTLAWSEPMLLPAALVGAPVLALTDNPVLAYNLAQILFQALSGWCAWYVTRRISGSDAGAIIAGLVFALSPFKTGYYQYLNIHLSLFIPLAFLSWYQFLVTLRWRYVFLSVAWVWLQAISIWYGAIPLVLLLTVLTLLFMLMYPGRWLLEMLGKAIAGGLVGVVAIAPVAWPYFTTRSELGFERGLPEIIKFRADVLSFFDAGRWHFLHQWIDSGREPGLMPGALVYLLCAIALVVLARALFRRGRAATVAAVVSLAAGTGALIVIGVQATGAVPSLYPTVLPLIALTFAGTGLFVLLRRRNASTHEGRGFSTNEWTGVVLLFVLAGVLLALGPVIHVNDNPAGTSPYLLLYHGFPGIKGIRISFRLAFVFLFFIGLLAALGLAAMEHRWRQRSRTLAVATLVLPLVTLAEYAHEPLHFEKVDWQSPSATYAWLAQNQLTEPSAALLELPTFDENIDSTYVFWSLHHRMRLVNGVSGFPSPILADLATLLKRIPATGDISMLREIDSLRYLKINLDRIRDAQLVADWSALADTAPAGLSPVARDANSIVFRIDDSATAATRWRQRYAARTLEGVDELVLDVTIDDLDSSLDNRLRATVNDSTMVDTPITDSPARLNIAIPQSRARPVTVTVQQSYTLRPDTRLGDGYVIGDTKTRLRADLIVQSATASQGDYAGIWLNGENIAMRRIGYNLAALDPATGTMLSRAAFDLRRGDGTDMARWIDSQPGGTVIVVALRRAGPPRLQPAVMRALAAIGATQNPKNPDLAHVVIGVMGATPGSAREMTGDTAIETLIGLDRRDHAMRVARARP